MLIDFLSAVFQIENTTIGDRVSKSDCFSENNSNVLRGEFYCFLEELYESNIKQLQENNIPYGLFYVPCTDDESISCKYRELAIGELAVIVEQL